MASNTLLKFSRYIGITLMVSTSLTGLTTLVVNAQDDAGVTKPGKGIPTRVDDSELRAAIAEAKKMRLTVDEKSKDVTVSTGDTEKTAAEIKASYVKQVKELKQKMAEYQTYKEQKAEYDKQIKELESDHSAKGTFDLNGQYGGFLNGKLDYEYTYHYDTSKKAIVVSKNSFNLTKQAADNFGAGFWDAVIAQSPKSKIPHDEAKGEIIDGSDTKFTGESIYNTVKDDKFGVNYFLGHNNKTDEYFTKSNESAGVPYTALKNDDGTWTLGRILRRNRQGESPNEYAGWYEIAPTAKITVPKAPVKPKTDVTIQRTNMLVVPDVNKDVEAGNVEGNPEGSANKQVFMKGDKMTYALSTSALPAGREKLKSLGFSDTLPKGFKYDEFKAFDKSGKDVTNQIKDVKVKDGVITGSYTGFNDDLNKPFDVPTIDLYGTANADNVKLENKFEFLVDGNPYESNKVENPTDNTNVKKDVQLGHTNGLDGTSIDGKTVVKGQELTYALKGKDLAANRAVDITSMEWTDKLPENVEFKEFKVFDGTTGEDITDQFKNTGKDKDIHIVAQPEAIKNANTDKKNAYKVPVVKFYVVANENGVAFENTAKFNPNGNEVESNTVNNQTPEFNPVKHDLDEHGNDIDGHDVKPGSTIIYNMDWDLTEMKDVAVSQEMMDKGLSFSDDYDETKLDVDDDVKNNVSIELKDDEDKATDDEKSKPSEDETIDNSDDDKAVDTENKVKSETDQDTTKDPDVEQPEDGLIVGEGTADKFDMNDVEITWDDKAGKFTISAKDVKSFLKKYAGKVFVIKFSPKVKADATGTVDNIATQNTFGNDKDTNKVSNNITPDAKPVEKELSHTGSTSFISRVIDSIKNILTK